jgi:hypothetical protein
MRAQSMELVLDQLHCRGYIHPALLLYNNLSLYLHHGWRMAFSVYSSAFPTASTYFHDEPLTDVSPVLR